ncbi:hypothetical protein BHE90_016671 [Fusarium euwallaceae]|uniref:Uncharacterized protein n=1 Tax=Fusarium euwallaceae TaxID=1147111 RepID=A0A430KZS0_9HYPO|nr:hypothetical protein BHE90_016671 [Fusarium euwallaceae]
METAGLVIGVAGLAGLFNTCLEAVDKVQSYQTFNTDSHILDTRFKAARVRFERWGPGVGIEQGKLLPDHHSALDDKDTSTVVTEVLRIIIKTICDASNAPPRRTRVAGPGNDDSSGLHRPYAVTSKSRRQKMNWALWGKGGRTEQVELFEKLVQELHNLVPPNTGEKAQRPYKPDTGRTDTLALGMDLNVDTTRLSDQEQGLLRVTRGLSRYSGSWLESRERLETRRGLHSWLGRCSPNERYHDSLRERVNGTCDWILDRPAFRHWLAIEVSAGPKLLWVNGPAGFGKTILCAHIVEHLSSILDVPVAHFFFTSNLESREDPYLALRSWISQIVSCHEGAFEHVRQKWESDSDPVATRAAVITLFTQLLHAIPGCTLVADGLDECTYLDNSSTSVAKFLHDVTDAVAGTSARVLLVSRDEPKIRHALIDDARESFAEYKIMPEDVRSDTAAYSLDIINRKLSNKRDDVRLTLSEAMTDRCQGQFLWLKMQEESLGGWMNEKQLQRTIANTPTGLDRLYDYNWTRIIQLGEWQRHRAFALLRWTAFALRPLTIYEITEAALILESEDLPLEDLPDDVDDEYVDSGIVGLCGPLLEVKNDPADPSPGRRTVHLPHFSVRQYLLCQLPVPGWILQNDRLQVSHEKLQNTVLAKACLQYVNLRQVWDCVLDDSPPPLGVSFRSAWRALIEADDAERQGKEAETILPGPLYYAVKLHLTNAAISLVTEQNVNETSSMGRSALGISCANGSAEVVDVLLEKGADITAVDKNGVTPLIAASAAGHTEVVKLLLEKGADITVANNDGLTPLIIASAAGHMEVVKLLLQKGAEIKVANNDGLTSLIAASAAGHMEVVKLLLEKGADITVANNDGLTPLIIASAAGHMEVVKLLLEKGADIRVANNDGLTLLIAASAAGHIEVAKLLLEKGADVKVANNDGWTPLIIASAAGHIEVIKLLLEKGANIRVANNDGLTPLIAASVASHIEVVKLLLEKGADITVANNNGLTPLIAALVAGHMEVVKLLLEKGADIKVANNDGWTPLIIASAAGNIEGVKLLLEKGADITAIDNDGCTPLIAASNQGHIDVVKLLLEKGADVTAVDNDGLTPLIAASRNDHIEVVKLLLDRVDTS